MDIKKISIVVGLVIVVIILAAVASMGVIILDLMSYTATGSETLSPAGSPVGHALVVYDPGVSGIAKNVATKIAGDLQTKGYQVDLAGVRNAAAANTSGDDVIVIGGPTYAGNVSSSIKSYLLDLKPSTNAKIGVFATGSVKPESDDPVYLVKFVSSLPADSPLKVKSAMKVLSADNVDNKCSEFVNGLLH